MDKVFGLGLPKTGTKTLKFALMELGYKKPKKCKQKYTSLYRDIKYDKLYEIVREANNVSDSPWWLMYRQLEAWWPNAYFILTTRRSENDWFGSVIRHINSRGMSALNFKNVFDMDINDIDKSRLTAIYRNHNTNVRMYFSNHPRFKEVCWEDGLGWDPLCKMLNKPVPKKDFPWKNKSSRS